MKSSKNNGKLRTVATPTSLRKDREKALVIDLFLKGNNRAQVKEILWNDHRLDYGSQAIARIIKSESDRWAADRSQNIEIHINRELEKISVLERAYWQEWERSRQEAISQTEKKKSPALGKGQEKAGRIVSAEKSVNKKTSTGDPQYLRGVQWCIDKRGSILGLDQPTTAIQINNTNNGKQSSSTTILRSVTFKTRQTTSRPQTFEEAPE